MFAQQHIIDPAVHAIVFKAANSNTFSETSRERARADRNRGIGAERSVRDTVRTFANLRLVPEHLF